MEYSKAAEILNRRIFTGDKRTILINIADYPERFIGLFRPTKPKAKILQNLLQSHEIRFGDAIEELLKAIISEMGYSSLEGRLQNLEGERLSLDQYFTNGEIVYFVEQKVRDDHDSTKKRGQIRNFESKLEILNKIHPDRLVGIMYFIDPELEKNKNYYLHELSDLSVFYNVPLYLFYGPELFVFLGHPELWDELISWLMRWKSELPDLPEVNFDNEPIKTSKELMGLPLSKLRRLINNKGIWDEGIIQVLFKDGTTLRLVLDEFSQKKTRPYLILSEVLKEKLDKYYGK